MDLASNFQLLGIALGLGLLVGLHRERVASRLAGMQVNLGSLARRDILGLAAVLVLCALIGSWPVLMRRANQRAKPVITGTQMLESMTSHRLPTRTADNPG